MMNRSYRHLRVSALLVFFFIVTANTPVAAALFSIEWQAKVGIITGSITDTNVPETILKTGDPISASGFFDDTSTVMTTRYPETGITEVKNVSDYSATSNIFDDVIYDFSKNLNDLIAAIDQIYVNIEFSQYRHDIYGDPPGVHVLHYRDPGIEIVFSGFEENTSNWGRVSWIGPATAGVPSQIYTFYPTNVTVSVTPLSAAPVPEPMTFLLLATGLVGLAGSRLKRKNKR